MTCASCIYEGRVRHRRFQPKRHDLELPLFMMYLDLDELPGLFDDRLLWSASRPALAWFRRRDFLGDPDLPLADAVRDRLPADAPAGPIRLLANLRYCGVSFNPVSFYYCFDDADHDVHAIVAEITNTPWLERHAYVLAADDAEPWGGARRWRFDKRFYVSPFMRMEQTYDWVLAPPSERLFVHMRNEESGVCTFDATLDMRRVPMTGRSLARVLARYPLMTSQAVAKIYLEAARLRLKGIPGVPRPRRSLESTR